MSETPGRYIVPFGAVMLMLVGAFNVLDGIVALTKPEYFSEDLLVLNLTAWGWFFALFGGVQFLVGLAVLRGSAVALWPGVVLAAANALAQLANVRHFPVWSISIMVLDVLVIYGFTVRGMGLGTETVAREPLSEAPARDYLEASAPRRA
jgi:hypothetical protein